MRPPHEPHASAFDTWTYEIDEPLSLAALRETASQLPAGVYRAKGIVYVDEVPDRRIALHVVGRRVDIALLDAWGSRARRTRVVAIGAPGTFVGTSPRDAFERCTVQRQRSSAGS